MLLGRSLTFAFGALCVVALASAQSPEKTSEAPRNEAATTKTSEAPPVKAAATETGSAKTTEAPRVEGAAAKTIEAPPAGADNKANSKAIEATRADSPETKPSAPTGAYKDAKGVRHDPAGKKGISSFWEAIRRGDEAALANDYPTAEAAYQLAIGIEPKNPVVHLRRGQALVRAGKLALAEAAYQQALLTADKDPTLHATALFVLADLKERQGLRDEAIAAWAFYADDLRKQASAKGYPETPIERDKRLKKYKEVAAESQPVRERIELRVKEVDESNKRKAAKNPNANR